MQLNFLVRVCPVSLFFDTILSVRIWIILIVQFYAVNIFRFGFGVFTFFWYHFKCEDLNNFNRPVLCSYFFFILVLVFLHFLLPYLVRGFEYFFIIHFYAVNFLVRIFVFFKFFCYHFKCEYFNIFYNPFLCS